MQLSLSSLLAAALLSQEALAQAGYGRKTCQADKCFGAVHLQPPVAKIATQFCKSYIRYTPTITRPCSTIKKTQTVTVTSQTATTFPDVSITVPTTLTPEQTTVTSACSTITSFVEGTFTTSVTYPSRAAQPGGNNNKRALPLAIPAILGANCGSGKPLTAKISSACSCFLGPTKTVTPTPKASTVKTTVTVTSVSTGVASTNTQLTTITPPAETATSCVAATTVVTTQPGGAGLTCGVPVSTYTTGGSLLCPSPTAPSATNARFRIEGATGQETIYEGCTESMGETITTPSGGSHLCDGTNGNANPSPGATLTTQIDAAGDKNGFSFDGTYSNSFQDFFINSIAGTTSTGNQFWGVFRNRVFTSRGGCQEQAYAGDEGLWVFDAFNTRTMALELSIDYAVVRPGDVVSLIVRQQNTNGGGSSPIGGIGFAGTTSSGDGTVSFTAPMDQGCYQYKAIGGGNTIPSAAFYLTVVEGL